MPDAKEIFADALELPPDSREAFVRARCDTDATLAHNVLELLRVHDASAEFLHAPTLSADRLAAGDEQIGDSLGPYTLRALLGEGGYGRVYRATQREPIAREVALKIIKLGMDTRRVTQRFEAERQTLARLDHPAVATIFDAGSTPAGRPYFAMELVAGEPVTDFAQRTTLSLDARLHLFISICRAVQYCHQRGVIHRDLKPANILVSDTTGAPLAKIIDFGIAKLVEDSSASSLTRLTIEGPFLGTPEYASPEQASGDTSRVDTRSDVYALGVILYELLTGTTPRAAAQWGHVSYAALQKLIAAHEPIAPATLLRQRNPRSRDITRITGPLDWITLRALATDPAQRYQSVADLADDLERALAHQPVTAAPHNAAYRARVFLRRNRLAVGVASIVLLGVLATAAGTTYGLLQARKQEQIARDQLARADAVGTVLKDALKAITPEAAQGRDTALVKQLLERAEASITDTQTPLPATVQVELRTTLAQVYLSLGESARSTTLARSAYELATTSLPDTDPLWHTVTGNYAKALAEDHSSNLNSAAKQEIVRLFEEALARANRNAPPPSRDVAVAMSDLAWARYQTHRFPEALQLLQDALAMHDDLGVPDLRARVHCQWVYVAVCIDLSMVDEAFTGMRRLQDDFARLPDSNPVDELLLQGGVTRLLTRANRTDDARDIFTTLIPRAREILGPSHPETVKILVYAGENEARAGNTAASFARYAEAHEAALAGPSGRESALQIERLMTNAVYDYASACAAEPMARAHLADALANAPQGDAVVASRLITLARLCNTLRRWDEGLQLAHESLALRERLFRIPSVEHVACMIHIAHAHLGLGELDLAYVWAARADAITRERTSPGNPYRESCEQLLARIFAAQTQREQQTAPSDP
ncbi:MAG TPA: serine/threonine-protein kinase [Phycisphaerales bacterium]|nr:serine/threonine-protein kinase [Phycisphaerales bacterium]